MKLQVATKLFINDGKGKYLLIQRSEPLPDGSGIKWDIPGGRIKNTERLEEALVREVREEIGITLTLPVTLIKAQDVVLQDIDLHVVRLTYTTNLKEPVMLGKEHQTFK